MGLVFGICNENLICELERETGKTMILYTVDGYGYYAILQKIIDHRVAVLVPGAGQARVIIRHPDQTYDPQGMSVIQEGFTLLDLSIVVAKTVGLSEIPPGFVWIIPPP